MWTRRHFLGACLFLFGCGDDVADTRIIVPLSGSPDPTSPPSSGSAAIFFLSAHSLPSNAYLTIYGFNLSSVTDVQVNSKSQTIVNTASNYSRLPLHPALMKLGKDTGVFNVDLTVDGTGEPTNSETYQKMDIQLDNVTSGDTGIQFVGAGLITERNGTINQSDTSTDFAVHTGSVYFVASAGSNGNPGTEAQPFQTFSYAQSQMTPGDALYVRQHPTEWNTVQARPGGGGNCYFAFSAGGNNGASGLPLTISAYPGEVINTDAEQGHACYFGNAASELVTDVQAHGFEHIDDSVSPGSSVAFGFRNSVRQRRIYVAGNYAEGVYAGTGGAFCAIGGGAGASSYATGDIDQYFIGNHADLTSEPDLGQSMAHVFYQAGRGWFDGTYFMHNRATRHGQGRVMQFFGHSSGEQCRNNFVHFNNMEGRKQDAGSKPASIIVSHSDGEAGQNGGRWIEDISIRYNTVSGSGNTGTGAAPIAIWAIESTDDTLTRINAIVENNVCYNNASDDIALRWYRDVICRDNITEAPIVDDQSVTGSTRTISGNVTTYPTPLQ